MNFLVYLHSIGLTHKKLFELFSSEQNYREIFENLDEKILQKIGCTQKERENILDKYNKIQTKKLDEILTKLDVKIITFFDASYPPLLKHTSQVPFILYVRGNIDVNDNFFAVVGSRKMTPYSKKVGQNLIADLSEYFVIVSGGAGGCDTLAHQICIEKNKKTIVVFGTGIDQMYPAGNRILFEKVLEYGGALVSTFPIGTSGSVYTFPVRNEVVAGMSRGVLVLEAGIKSGTLITAQLALEQGKDVFAVPGDIFQPNFEGSHHLIQNGSAKIVMKSQDILEEYNFSLQIPIEQNRVFQNEIQSQIYELLKYNMSLNIDDFIEKTSLSYSDISLNVSLMEIQGMVQKDMFGKYERIE